MYVSWDEYVLYRYQNKEHQEIMVIAWYVYVICTHQDAQMMTWFLDILSIMTS